MAKFNVGDKVVINNLDDYDKAFRPKLKDGMSGEIIETDNFGEDLYVVKIGDEQYAVFEDQLKAEND